MWFNAHKSNLSMDIKIQKYKRGMETLISVIILSNNLGTVFLPSNYHSGSLYWVYGLCVCT